MPNPQNVIPHQFQPGQSGNPAGSSRKQRLTTALLEYLDEDPKRLEALMKVGYKEALGGNYQFWRHLFDRIDGPIAEPSQAPEEAMEDELDRIIVPKADDRAASRPPRGKGRRKAEAPDGGGDVPA